MRGKKSQNGTGSGLEPAPQMNLIAVYTVFLTTHKVTVCYCQEKIPDAMSEPGFSAMIIVMDRKKGIHGGMCAFEALLKSV